MASIAQSLGPMAPIPKQRPPRLNLEQAPAAREPARSEKITRRDSRLGLRSIFGRSKAIIQEDVGLGNLASPTTAARFADTRPSVTNMGTRPYNATSSTLNSSMSVLSIPEEDDSEAVYTASAFINNPSSRATQPTKAQPLPPAGSTGKLSKKPAVAAAQMPPLFRTLPNAICYATLPATRQSAEIILRGPDKKVETLPGGQASERNDESGTRNKKKHRRQNSATALKLDWTTKVYVLTSNGSLLQYAGEGPLDRLPDKMLRLDKDSAAFVSDAIPGKHWVLQVTSGTGETEGPVHPESRSILSRLTGRGVEKRETCQLLMVFAGAGDMEEWMMALRQEISRLEMSDEGALADGSSGRVARYMQLRERHSQQTLVGRDSQRYSLASTRSQDSGRKSQVSQSLQADAPGPGGEQDSARDASMDDTSTTNSSISRDGRQLDNLRDSTHRLSYMSFDQRTTVTSVGSSPLCSPTLGVFPKPPNNANVLDSRSQSGGDAAAVTGSPSKRQSMYLSSDTGDSSPEAHPLARPSSSLRASMVVTSTGLVQAPNFSVPASSNRRYSRSMSAESLSNAGSPTDAPTSPEQSSVQRQLPAARKSPPSSLRLSRPLSMVLDQPSPREALPDRPITRHGDERPVTPTQVAPMPPHLSPEYYAASSAQPSGSMPSRRQSFRPAQAVPRPSPRRLTSLDSLRTAKGAEPQDEPFNLPTHRVNSGKALLGMSATTKAMDQAGRRRSSIETRPLPPLPRSSFSTAPPSMRRKSKRLSVHSVLPDGSIVETEVASFADLPPPAAPPPSMALPALPTATPPFSFCQPATATAAEPQGRMHLSPDVKALGLVNRRSMPHLAADSAPPAPPPTCALPPVPPRPRARV